MIAALCSQNVMAAESDCKTTEKDGKYHFNCCCRGLKGIPVIPKFASSVDLSKNSLTDLRSVSPFAGMTALSEVDMSDNPLRYISMHIFDGLVNLTTLLMRKSLLYKQSNLNIDLLLSDLKNLRQLAFTFQYQQHRVTYVEDCSEVHKTQPFGKVDSLHKVQILEIDSALLKRKDNNTLKHDSFQCKKLHLVNGIFCFYSYLTRKQFEYMTSLKSLTIIQPLSRYITCSIADDFVQGLLHLKTLTIQGHHYRSTYLTPETFMYNVTKSIRNLNQISKLALVGIGDKRGMVFNCHQDNMTDITSLKEIDLSHNYYRWIYAKCDQFPVYLNTLIFRNNCMSSSHFNFGVLKVNKHLVTVDASDQNLCPEKMEIDKATLPEEEYKQIQVYDLRKFVFTKSIHRLHFGFEEDKYPLLQYLDLSHNNRTLYYEKPSDVIPTFFSRSRPNLEHLYMSNCGLSYLEQYSFSNFSKLKYLDLSSNKLWNMHCDLSDRLIELTSLKEINLASNTIECIKPYLFARMKYIEMINISENELRTFDPSLTESKNLKYLDLSHNMIQMLGKDTLQDLDRLEKAHPVHLDLTGNTLQCSCETLDFLHWMDSTKIDLVGKENYRCSFGIKTIAGWENVSRKINTLVDECTSPNTSLIIGVSASVALSLAVIFGVSIYRCRWRLRYWYYKSKIKLSYETRGHDYERIYEYDMFIAYSSEDQEIVRQGVMNELESKRGLLCCIHERDFKAGESIPFNISKGIRESKRTVLFLSKSFLASEWCMYELNIARMEALHTGRKVILVVKLDNIPNKSLPIDVLDVIDLYTYLEYPKGESDNDLDVFWSKCADFVDDA